MNLHDRLGLGDTTGVVSRLSLHALARPRSPLKIPDVLTEGYSQSNQ